MGSALPIVSDCRASCDCTSTVNVTQLIADAVDNATRFVFDNAVAARADTGYADDRWILLKDLVVVGDGLGGQYVFDADSVLADDGLTVLKPDAIDAADPGRYIKVV